MAYKDFIPQNVASSSARRIGVYDINGNRVGQIPLGKLKPPTRERRLYSFGALSDVHIGDSTSTADFTAALKYLSAETDFICISGDLIHNKEKQTAEYKSLIETYATVPVYACAGNHDGAYVPNIETAISGYTGHPLYYSITYGDDVFIFVGCKSSTGGSLFTADELTWLSNTLEAHKNRRVFLFEHVRPDDACGNALRIYTLDIWSGTEQTVFENLLRQYPNIIFFHGHSHLKFNLQQYADKANIDKIFGCWSVHIPSITVPRGPTSSVDTTRVELYAESEGYVVDVYNDGIHLRGRDFIKGKFLPIASYWLNTTI
jgi:UDP-2,3-diacylglucosamine pyrophosphatase LpxH